MRRNALIDPMHVLVLVLFILAPPFSLTPLFALPFRFRFGFIHVWAFLARTWSLRLRLRLWSLWLRLWLWHEVLIWPPGSGDGE